MVGTTDILAVTPPQVNFVWVTIKTGVVFDMLNHGLVTDEYSFAQYQHSVALYVPVQHKRSYSTVSRVMISCLPFSLMLLCVLCQSTHIR